MNKTIRLLFAGRDAGKRSRVWKRIYRSAVSAMIGAGALFAAVMPAYADTAEDNAAALVYEADSDPMSIDSANAQGSASAQSTAAKQGDLLSFENADPVSHTAQEGNVIQASTEPLLIFSDNGMFYNEDGSAADTQNYDSNAPLASQIVSFASQYIGRPYRYGGASLQNGADCSGFVMAVYGHFGISLPHYSGALAGVGKKVESLAQAVPGDILAYSGHVGIYLGNGRMLSALSTKRGITVVSATYKPIRAIRRVI